MDYTQAKLTLATARDASKGKPIANNTRLFARGDDIAVRLHHTDVATMHADGSVTLNSGGYRTMTTRDRMQRFAPVRVWSSKGTWYACRASCGTHHLFADGMRLFADGTCTGAAPDDTPAIERALRKRIKAYAIAFIDALYDGKVPAPSLGDCWGCCMRTADGRTPMGGADHILAHLEESYFVPSLLVNAMTAAGMGDYQRSRVHALMTGIPERREEWVYTSLIKAVRKYCTQQLGMAA